MSDISVKIPNLENQKSIADSLSKIAGIQSNINGIVRSLMSDYWKTIYPIGSVYISMSGTSPAELFGGTWERIYNRFLWAGAEWKTLSTSESDTNTYTFAETTHARFGDPASNQWAYFDIPAGSYTRGQAVSLLNGYDPAYGVVKILQVVDPSGTPEAGTTFGEAQHTLTQSELPKITGNIWNVAYQDTSITHLGTSGVFSPLKRNEGHGAGTYASNNGYDGFSMSFGDDKPHNNMPPALAVYMWKRVA